MKNLIKNIKSKSKVLIKDKRGTSKVQQNNKSKEQEEHKFSRRSDPYLDAMLEEQQYFNNDKEQE